MQENNPTYAHIAEIINKNKNAEVIVDCGCGTNQFKKTYNSKIIGLDPVLRGMPDILADGTMLPIKNDSVHIFLSNCVLEHVEKKLIYLKELKRCINQKGFIILSIPLPIWYFAFLISYSTWWSAFKNFRRFLKNPMTFLAHGRPHMQNIFEEIKEWNEKNTYGLLAQAGLIVKSREKTCNILSVNTRCANIFGKIQFPHLFNTQVTYILEKTSAHNKL